MFKVPNQYRIREGKYASTDDIGNMGAFLIPFEAREFVVIASDGLGWEHVSVSSKRTPSWKEMCYFKDLFWDEDDVVVQYHPKRSEYVNLAENCLHLWRPIGQEVVRPPVGLVGVPNK